MGKATRWFRGLFGIKKGEENVKKNSVTNSEKKEKRRWVFANYGKDSRKTFLEIPLNDEGNIPMTHTALLRSCISETEDELYMHAIAVAAARATEVVIRLTGIGGDCLFAGGREMCAATKIQALFRGFLARKALRALRGLVKLQAIVRGCLVRKRTTAALHRMRALIRAQVAVPSQGNHYCYINENQLSRPGLRARKAIERFDFDTETGFKCNGFSSTCDPFVYPQEESLRLLEIDNLWPKSRSKKINASVQECGHDYRAISSPLPYLVPSHLSVPVGDCQQIQEFNWDYTSSEGHRVFAGAQSNHRCASSARYRVAPVKNVCGDSFFRPYSNCPNYMSHTQSFSAKLRSYSAPRLRTEPASARRLSYSTEAEDGGIKD